MGSVRARSNGRAKLSYEWADDDVETLKRGMVLSAKILLAGGAVEVRATGHGCGWHPTAEALAAEIADLPLSAFILYSAHPMSTSPMGIDPETAVVNARGKVHRLDGLYMADAGIFPTSLGVNPQLTTMTLGTMVGRAIVADEVR